MTNENSLSSKAKTHFLSRILELKKCFEIYPSQIPVIGFNSGKYEINLIKEEIMFYVASNYLETDIHTMKKENSYLAISTPQLKFLITLLLVLLLSIFEAYGCDIPKGIFLYEWFDSFVKLTYSSLPEMKDFYSTLSNSNPLKSEADYLKLKEIWSTQGMQSFKDYLIYYNNLDTDPFVTALSSFVSIYTKQKIDIFKEYVTLPEVTRKLLNASMESNFSLINQQNADLYYTYRKNIVGGSSVIFSRYYEKSISNIKKKRVINVNLTKKKNSLFLWDINTFLFSNATSTRILNLFVTSFMIIIYPLTTPEAEGSLTESKITSDIATGQLFGAVEVDISVKEEFKHFFQNFPPFLHLSSVNV